MNRSSQNEWMLLTDMAPWCELAKGCTAGLADPTQRRCPCAVNSAHCQMGPLHLLDGQREGGRSAGDGEDSMSKGKRWGVQEVEGGQ